MTVSVLHMRLKPPPGGKLVRDWNGKKVRLLRACTSGWGTMPVGTLGTVTGAGNGVGLEFTSTPCPHCGVTMRMTKLSDIDVQVVE